MSRFNFDRIEGYERLSPELSDKLMKYKEYLCVQAKGLGNTVERINQILKKSLME